jgi:hypothetical protein
MDAPANMQGSDAGARDAGQAVLGNLSVVGAFAAMAVGAILALSSLMSGARPATDRQAGSLPQPAATTAPVPQPNGGGTAGGAGTCAAQPQQPVPAAANPGAGSTGGAAFAVRTVIIRDTFGRKVVRGWGTAVQGGRYVISGTRSGYAVDGSAGSQVTPASGTTEVGGLGVDASALEARVRVSFNRYSRSGGENRARIIVRANTATDARTYDYEFGLSAPDGKRNLEAWIMRRVARKDAGLGGDMDTGLVQKPGAWFWLRGQIWGSGPVHLRLKVWSYGTPEPAAWNVDVVDINPPRQLRAGGHLLLSSYGNSGLPLRVKFDDLRAARLRVTAGQASASAVPAPAAAPAPDCSASAAGR